MKLKNLFLALICFAALHAATAQTTITLAPDSNGKDVTLMGWSPNTNFGISEWYVANAWTWQGNPGVERSLMEFDLSSLPSNAVILSATLKLYGDSNQWGGNSQLSGSNEAFVQRITSAWNEHTVTWNTQPTSTTAGEAYIPAASAVIQNREVNVTQLVSDARMANETAVGFMIRLANEAYYRRMVFGSFDNANVNRRPKLEITYVTGTTGCVTYKMNSNGKDAAVFTLNNGNDANTNFGNDISYQGTAWTYQGTPGTARGLMEFDFSNIPAGAVLTAAKLSLYCNTASWAKHSRMSGINKAFLQRITGAWSESTVTWNNQPAVTTQNQIVISPSVSDVQNYPDINVLPLIKDGLSNNGQTSVGMMIRLETEQHYRAMHFLSGDNSDSTLRPTLNVCYVMPKVSLSTPNGGEVLLRNNPYNITWSSSLVDSVKIMYSADSGATWNLMAGNLPSAQGSYTWTPVSAAGTNYLIRVVHYKYSNIYDESNVVFAVRNEPVLAVTSANGGEVWFNNNNYNVTWTASYSANVKIEYSTDGNTWNTAAASVASASGSYTWSIPSITTTTARIRITDVDYPAYGDMSDADFTIRTAPAITVTSPDGGETWYNNTTQPVTWTSSNSTNVKIEYSTNGNTWNTVVASVASSAGTYSWALPSINSATVKVRISDADFPAYSDASNNDFSIVPPSVQVTSPNGGESWAWGSQQTITWTTAGVSAVNLEYSIDGGSTWNTISNGVTSNSFNWTLPMMQSNTGLVRVTDAGTSGATDMSNAVFSITAGVGIRKTVQVPVVIYPNPSTGKFTLQFPEKGTRVLVVTDLQGKEVITVHTSTRETLLDLTSLSKGIYLLRTADGISKLVIQ